MVRLLSSLKIKNLFLRILNTKFYVITKAIYFISFVLIIFNIDTNTYYSTSLMIIKLWLILGNIIYFFHLQNIKLYQFSLFFSYYRKSLLKAYLSLHLSFLLKSIFYLYVLFLIPLFLNNMIIYFSLFFELLLLGFVNMLVLSIIYLLLENKLGVIFILIISVILALLNLNLFDTPYVNVIYDNEYYLNMHILPVILMIISLLFVYSLIFLVKERR